jgi:membrane-associated protease RseP (regulator of RpoE activity)
MRMRPALTDSLEVTMRNWLITLAATGALAGLASPALGDGDEATLEQRLADAQRRLEDAAREVAELSGQAAGTAGAIEFDRFLGNPRRAMLGVNLGGAAPGGGGVRVESVSPGGPAAEAGVKSGDVIVAIQAKPVVTGREVVRAMQSIEPGEKVALRVQRAGKPVELTVEARPLDHTLFIASPGAPWVHAMPAPLAIPFGHGDHWLLEDWGSAEFVTLTPGLGRYFGAEKGVLVARAPEDASLGLQDGDVILAIGGREPQSGSHAMRILRSYQAGEAVELRILRDRRTQTLSARIPERKAGDPQPRARVPRPPGVPAPPAPPPPESAAAT